MNKKNNKKLIIIAGGTSSGKTMFAEIIKKGYEKNNKTATLISMDNYYKSIDLLPEKNGELVNWDSPKVIDWKKFFSDVENLMNGNNIKKQNYNFSTYSYDKEEIEYFSSDYIIIEGLFALFDKKIRKMGAINIFVDVDDDIRLMRRISRDKLGRYKNEFEIEKFLLKWKDEIKPMHKKYVQPTNEYADFIIKNNNEFIGDEKERMINILQSIMVK